MKELEYQSDEKARGTVVCPYVRDKEDDENVFVGSMFCWNCKYFKRIDLKKRVVHCMYEETVNINDLFK